MFNYGTRWEVYLCLIKGHGGGMVCIINGHVGSMVCLIKGHV